MHPETDRNHHQLSTGRVTRRMFVKSVALIGALPVIGGLLAACATDDDIGDDPEPGDVEVDDDDDSDVDDVQDDDETPEPEDALDNQSARDTIIFASHQGGLNGLNVLYVNAGNSLSSAQLAQRGLLFIDEDSNWIGELATDVPSRENGGVSEDGLSITFNLREGVTWHDGMPVKSDDVKATWEAIMNPDNAVVTRYGYDKIESIDTPDDHTVVLNFSELFVSWPILFNGIVPRHIIEANTPGLDESEAMRVPIGFGPYKIVEWAPDEHVRYEAFEDYWQGAPKIKNFIHRFYANLDSMMQALEAGEIDMAWSIPITYVPQVQALEDRGVNLVTTPAPGCERYFMNADADQAPLFADHTLRVALHHAVDRHQIVDELLLGMADIGVSAWHGTPWEHPSLPEYEYDPDRCRELLESIGWEMDTDGYMQKDGERLSFVHTHTSGDLVRENVQLLVQQMYSDAGIEMIIENQRTSDLFSPWAAGGVWAHGAYEMGGRSHGLREPDPEISNQFLCREIPSDENPTGAQFHRYCNPELDEVLIEQAQTIDPNERTELIYQAQEIMHDDAYFIFLYSTPLTYAVSSSLQGFVLHPFNNYFWNPQEWWFES